MENSDEEYAFTEQMNEAMAASSHAQDEFLMALRFQEMLENQFSSQNNNDFKDAPDEFDEVTAEEINTLEEWRGLVEEYKKLSATMEKLNLIEVNEDCEEAEIELEEWNDAVEEFHSIERVAATADQEDEFSEASCSFESEKGFYSLYFKGVSEMRPWESKLGLSATAIGFILRKPEGEILLEVQKNLGYYVDEIVAEHLALIEGLVAALEQGVVRIHAFTGSELLYNQVARGKSLENQLLWAVRERVLGYVRRLDDFMLTFNTDSADGRNVMFMTREAIYPSSIPRSVVALHVEYGDEDEDDGVLSCGLGQKRQRSYGQGRFHNPAWGGTSEFNGSNPRTQTLGINSWKEREKGIGEWKFL